MIDLITLTKNHVPENEVTLIVDSARLQECTRNGRIYYETSAPQKNREHIYIRVEANSKLKVECSLHKLFEQTTTGHYTNYGPFSLEQAREIMITTLAKNGIDASDIKVYGYEIGVNIYMSQDCRAYMDLMETIGPVDDRKPFFINPRYKDHRAKTTLFHRHVRKHFKVYDKGFEARDKRRNDVPEGNILRIESVFRRVENMSFDEFFSADNLAKIRDRFFRDWWTVQFTRIIQAPKGTGAKKKDLCEMILKVGTETALSQAREKQRAGILTEREFRSIREFIVNEWDSIKHEVCFIATDQEIEFREKLNQAKIFLSN